MSDDDGCGDPTAATLLSAMRTIVATRGPLPPLDAATYARTHAEFEARSDQRRRIVAWLASRATHAAAAATHESRPLRMLSVGCGDGTVDAAVADAVLRASDQHRMHYVGVEPFGGSAGACSRRLADAGWGERLNHEVQVATFDQAELSGPFDLVTFVHSMYYVPDVAKAARSAYDLVGEGGTLLVLSAPRSSLNHLAGMLAPPVEDHPQWFSDDVAFGLDQAGLRATRGTIDARVDLSGADEGVLDFTVQALLDAELRELVGAYLAAVAVPGTTAVVPHPVDTYTIDAPC